MSLLIALWLCVVPVAQAQVDGEGDFLVSLLGDTLSGGPLPNGPLVSGPTLTPVIPAVEPRIEALAFSPEGELVGMQTVASEVPGPLQVGLFLIPASGELEFYGVGGTVPLEFQEFPLDFGFDPEGRLFVLVQWFSIIGPVTVEYRILEIDPDTGEILGRYGLGREVSHMATSPRGFWMVGDDRLWHYNTKTLVLDDPEIPLDFGLITDASADSTGALWLMSEPGFIDPPIFSLSRFDPVTGAERFGFYSTQAGAPLIAVRRRCVSSDTVRCLMGGRFQAKISWRDFENREGEGKVAPSASADSGLFWFFEASNWEVLVKIIDGCTRNGHYWVYTAGTTDVEYTLEVTDLLTGEVFESTNVLGRAAPAVTEGRAFATCP
jgi:hypothetical protein